MTGPDQRWIVRWRRVEAPRLRLYCFPYAGGGATVYRDWAAGLPADVEVCAVQPPGRENRTNEPLATRLDHLLPALVELLGGERRPYATFGHSLGAMVSYEAVRQVRRRGRALPTHVFVSGRPAPQTPPWYSPIHELPDDEFCRRVVELNGTDAQVLSHPQLAEHFIPILRADFAISERHRHVADEPLPVPLTAFCGTHDPTVAPAAMAGWAEHTRGGFALRVLPGDHFFLRTARDELLTDLRHHLRPLPAPA